MTLKTTKRELKVTFYHCCNVVYLCQRSNENWANDLNLEVLAEWGKTRSSAGLPRTRKFCPWASEHGMLVGSGH